MSDDEKPGGIIGPILHDILGPPAREIGNTFGGVVRMAFAKINTKIWEFDTAAAFVRRETEAILEQRHVPEEAIQPPAADLLLPAIQRLRYADQDEALRQLYLELIATAMDSRRQTHPAYTAIISELSAAEAKVLPQLAAGDDPPVIAMISLTTTGAHGVHRELGVRYRTLLGEKAGLTSPLSAMEVENLARLGLVRIDNESHLVGEDASDDFERIRSMPDVVAVAGETDPYGAPSGKVGGVYARFQGLIVTRLGWDFARACTSPIPRGQL